MPTIDIRLPWGNLDRIASIFLNKKPIAIFGCLSSEDRCRAVPEFFADSSKFQNTSTLLLQVDDPKEAFPDHSEEIQKKIDLNIKLLEKNEVSFSKKKAKLLDDESRMVKILNEFQTNYLCSTLILDISTLPKRFYALFLKRLVKSNQPENIIVTYSQPAQNGYPTSKEHLAEDIQPCSHLPGFAPSPGEEGCTVVISLGFEKFNIESILSSYRDNNYAKFLLNFPPNGEYFRRQWKILRDVIGSWEMRKHIEVISALDVEQVFLTLEHLHKDYNRLILAPFGPKPHTLGMILFAIKYDCGLIYSQPQSYNPNYSIGIGQSWSYVVKWDGITCFNRTLHKI